MKWKNVKLIFRRELRDQLRDRRTLFTVAIMPLVLYPLMSMAMHQVAQVMREYPTKVWIVGAENMPTEPTFLVDGGINPEFVTPEEQALIQLNASNGADAEFQKIVKQLRDQSEIPSGAALVDELIKTEMKKRGFDVAVIIPSPVAIPDRVQQRSKNLDTNDDADAAVVAEVRPENPENSIYIFLNSANDKSRMGADRF